MASPRSKKVIRKKSKKSCLLRVHPGELLASNSAAPGEPPNSDSCKIFRKMVDLLGDEVMLIDSQARIRYANKACLKGLGQLKEDVLSKRVIEFFTHRISFQKWKKVYFDVLRKKKKPIKFRLERTTRSKKRQVLDITCTFLEYQDYEFILSVGRDVSRQNQLQTSLRQSEDLYRLVTESSRDGIFMADVRGNITYGNEALMKLVNISLKEAQRQNFRKYVHKKSLKKAVACFQKAKNGTPQMNEEIEILDKNNNAIPVEINSTPLFKGGKVFAVLASIRDIRNRRKLEEMVHQSEKIEAVQLFVSGTAQELKHPLRIVSKKIQALYNEYSSKEFEYLSFKDFSRLLATLKELNNQVKYCYDTTGRLIELSCKKIHLKTYGCQANKIIRKQLKLLENEFKSMNITCRTSLSDALPSITMGEIEFSQLIHNIIYNAMQALPGGGRLSVKTQFLRKTKQVRIDVQDDGIGIARENLKHIFEPFFTTKQRGVGRNSGLGLSIVYMMVREKQGDITVDSSLRKGTRVKIVLPALQPGAPAS